MLAHTDRADLAALTWVCPAAGLPFALASMTPLHEAYSVLPDPEEAIETSGLVERDSHGVGAAALQPIQN